MKVLVPLKRVIDPYVKVRVLSNNQGVETKNVKMSINPFDEIAIEEALRWKEKNVVNEVQLVSIGNQEVQESLRQGLALGADSALHIETSENIEPLDIAKILQIIVEVEKPNIIIMGKQAIDNDANQVGQMLAGLLNWPQATFASNITFLDTNEVQVTREVDGGLETLQIALPCVITTDLRLNEPRYATLPNIMQAKKKPLIVKNIADLSIELKKHQTITAIEAPQSNKKIKFVNSAEELIHYLKDIERAI